MKWLLLVALAMLTVSREGGAAQLKVGLRAGTDYDSNLNNSSTNAKGGMELSGGLDLALNSERDDLRWGLSYHPTYRKPLDDQRIQDQWRHRAQGDLRYKWSDATSFRSNFLYSLSSDSLNQAGAAPAADPTLPTVSGDRNIERFRLGGSATHRFSSRWSGAFSAAQSAVRFDQDSLSDSNTTTASSSLNYALSSRLSVGGGVTVTDQSTDSRTVTGNQLIVGDANGNPSVPVSGLSCDLSGVGPIPPGGSEIARVNCTARGQDTQFFQAFGRLSYLVNKRLSVSGSLGPTQINPSVGQSSTTIFADISLNGVFKRSRFSARFSRSESGSFGTTVSTVANTFITNWTWEPSEYWRTTLSGAYSMRESVQQSDSRTVDTYTIRTRATRRLTRRLDGFVFMAYRDQETKAARSSSGFDSFEAGIGFQYSFDPVTLGLGGR